MRNGVPHSSHDSHSDEGRRLLDEAGLTGSALPVVISSEGMALVDPTNAELAASYGMSTELDADAELRRRRRRCGPGGPSGCCLRILRGSEHAGGRTRVDRWAVRLQLSHTELTRFYPRRQWRRARSARLPAGVGVRHALSADEGGRGSRAGGRAIRPLTREWTPTTSPQRDPRHRRGLSAARNPDDRHFHRYGSVLWWLCLRGEGVDRRERVRRRRRQLCWPGGHASFAVCPPCQSARAWPLACEHDVELPDREPCSCAEHRDSPSNRSDRR